MLVCFLPETNIFLFKMPRLFKTFMISHLNKLKRRTASQYEVLFRGLIPFHIKPIAESHLEKLNCSLNRTTYTVQVAFTHVYTCDSRKPACLLQLC